MKQRITQERLVAAYKVTFHDHFRLWAIFLGASIVGILLCLFTGAVVGVLFFLVIAGVSISSFMRIRGKGSPKEAYLVLEPVTKGYAVRMPDGSQEGDIGYDALHISFGEGNSIMVTKEEYLRAATGAMYYVAYFKKSNKIFACFYAEENEPDGTIEIRQSNKSSVL